MNGPRQGVHISPQHMQQWRQLHRLMRWRAFHFRDPDETYSYRARIEPQPPQLPAAEHKQNSSAFPARGVKRPSSAGGNKSRRPSTAPGTSVSGRATPTGTRTSSSTCVCLSPSSKQSSKASQKEPGSARTPGQTSGSEFSLSATSMSIQPRRDPQRCQTASRANKQAIVNVATFPYPDPSKVKGNPGFVSRLAELARLEAETIRSEQAKARLMSRPMSAKSLKSSVPYSASTKVTVPGRRTSVGVTTSRIPSGMKRLNSSPAVTGHTHQRGSSSSSSTSSVTLSRQLSFSERSRRVHSELNSVEEATLKSENSTEELVKEKQSIGTDLEGEPQVQRSTLRCTSEDTEESGNEGEVQMSCSPPIVFIKIPQCSWTVGEVIPVKEKDIADRNEGDRKNSESESVSEDVSTAKDESSSSGVSSMEATQDSVGNQNDKSKTFVEDDLKVTSDLGLSIDSFHLSQEENLESSDVAMTTVGQSSNGISHEHKSGIELESDLLAGHKVTNESLMNRSGVLNKTEGRSEVVERNNVKKSKKKESTSKRPTKLFNGSSTAAQVTSSSSSTSLKCSKSGSKKTHKSVKRSNTCKKIIE